MPSVQRTPWRLIFLALAALGAGLVGAIWWSATIERDWTITQGAVGEIALGMPLPLFVWGLLPDCHPTRYGDNLPAIGCDLPARDLSVRLGRFTRVQGIVPGPTYRTAQGTGQGSTLAELVAAHDGIVTSPIPEPYTCVARTPDLPDVYFEFTSCEAAASGAGVARVHIWTRLD